MAYETIIYDVQDGVGTITLNRPDSYNAANEQLTTDLQDALKQAAEDEAVRVVVLTGAGKAFCSGQDLKDAPSGGGKRSLRWTDGTTRSSRPCSPCPSPSSPASMVWQRVPDFPLPLLLTCAS